MVWTLRRGALGQTANEVHVTCVPSPQLVSTRMRHTYSPSLRHLVARCGTCGPLRNLPITLPVSQLAPSGDTHRLSPAQRHANLLAFDLTVEPVTNAESQRSTGFILSSTAVVGVLTLELWGVST